MSQHKQQTTNEVQATDTTRDELDLSQSEAFDRFLESAEDVYVDAARYRTVAQKEGYRSLQFDDVRGEELFTTLYVVLRELQGVIVQERERVQAKEGVVAGESVKRMQKLYDDMLLLRNVITAAYQDRVTHTVSTAKPVATPAPEQPVTSNVAGATTATGKEKQAIPQQPTAEQLCADLLQMTLTAKRQLDVIKVRVLQQSTSVAERQPAAEAIATFNSLVAALDSLYDRVTNSRNEVTDVVVLTKAKQTYAKFIQDILTKAEAAEGILQRSRDEKTVATRLSVDQHTSRVRPVPVTCGYGLTPVNETDLTDPELPSEAMVASLVKPILESWLYTDSERSKVLQSCEAFHRAVAMAEPTTVVFEKYQLLSDQVIRLKTAPDITELQERVDRILRRVTTGAPFGSEVLRQTNALAHAFREIVNDQQSSYELKHSAFNDLLTYVLDHESEWLTVCGMPVPLSGSKGVAMARALRETLLVERDRHGEIVRDAKKQVVVDKLIRKLSEIPHGGLSAEVDIPEVMSLMRTIDVMGQQGHLVTPAGESVPVSCFDTLDDDLVIKGLGSQDPTHKVMNISAEDNETTIAIGVARKTRERIAQQTQTNKSSAAPFIPEETATPQVTGAVVARMEAQDPINTAVPNIATARITSIKPIHEERSLTKLYLSDPMYQEFIAAYYSSPAAFERLLDTTVTQIEAKTVDVFERWLQEEKNSAFAYIEEMTVEEVLQLGSHRQVREQLLQQNIKYETFLTWLDLIPEMQSVVGSDRDIKFGALYSRWMIESEMAYVAAMSVH
jgi:hypothetical protein